MIFQKSKETRRRNCGHTNKDGKAALEWIKFVLQARIFVTKDQNYDNDGGKTDHDSKAGSKDNHGNGGNRSH